MARTDRHDGASLLAPRIQVRDEADDHRGQRHRADRKSASLRASRRADRRAGGCCRPGAAIRRRRSHAGGAGARGPCPSCRRRTKYRSHRGHRPPRRRLRTPDRGQSRRRPPPRRRRGVVPAAACPGSASAPNSGSRSERRSPFWAGRRSGRNRLLARGRGQHRAMDSFGGFWSTAARDRRTIRRPVVYLPRLSGRVARSPHDAEPRARSVRQSGDGGIRTHGGGRDRQRDRHPVPDRAAGSVARPGRTRLAGLRRSASRLQSQGRAAVRGGAGGSTAARSSRRSATGCARPGSAASVRARGGRHYSRSANRIGWRRSRGRCEIGFASRRGSSRHATSASIWSAIVDRQVGKAPRRVPCFRGSLAEPALRRLPPRKHASDRDLDFSGVSCFRGEIGLNLHSARDPRKHGTQRTLTT